MLAVELGTRLDLFGPDHVLGDVTTVDDVTAAIADTVPGFAEVTPTNLASAPNGLLADLPRFELPDPSFTATGRNSYDYRLVVSRKLYDRAVGTALSPSLVGLAPGPGVHVHPLDLDGLGVDDGAEVQVISARATAVLPIRANPGVARGVVWAPFNQGGGRIEDIIDSSVGTTDVRIERI
jgi:anaerobic selenocysteine-containing dehydrogenase